MKKIFKFISVSLFVLSIAACGGGSSSTGSSSANVTEQCLASSSDVNFVNGCDFVVNANVVFGNASNLLRNVGPNGFLFNIVALEPDIVIICMAPSEPSSDSQSCS